MIQSANYLRDDAVRGLESKLESRELTISELQGNIKDLKEALKRLEEETKQAEEDKQALSEQVEGLRSTNENNLALIQEYKEKIDTLSSLVNQYKGFADEEEKAKIIADFKAKGDRLVASNEELSQIVRDQQDSIEKLNNNIQIHEKEAEYLKVNHVNELTQLTDRKDLEKERAVLEIERKYQAKLEKIHEQYNNKVAALFEKLDRHEEDKKTK
jgi:chromosome segregation ATPase